MRIKQGLNPSTGRIPGAKQAVPGQLTLALDAQTHGGTAFGTKILRSGFDSRFLARLAGYTPCGSRYSLQTFGRNGPATNLTPDGILPVSVFTVSVFTLGRNPGRKPQATAFGALHAASRIVKQLPQSKNIGGMLAPEHPFLTEALANGILVVNAQPRTRRAVKDHAECVVHSVPHPTPGAVGLIDSARLTISRRALTPFFYATTAAQRG